jgi:hypothetical protein
VLGVDCQFTTRSSAGPRARVVPTEEIGSVVRRPHERDRGSELEVEVTAAIATFPGRELDRPRPVDDDVKGETIAHAITPTVASTLEPRWTAGGPTGELPTAKRWRITPGEAHETDEKRRDPHEPMVLGPGG